MSLSLYLWWDDDDGLHVGKTNRCQRGGARTPAMMMVAAAARGEVKRSTRERVFAPSQPTLLKSRQDHRLSARVWSALFKDELSGYCMLSL